MARLSPSWLSVMTSSTPCNPRCLSTSRKSRLLLRLSRLASSTRSTSRRPSQFDADGDEHRPGANYNVLPHLLVACVKDQVGILLIQRPVCKELGIERAVERADGRGAFVCPNLIIVIRRNSWFFLFSEHLIHNLFILTGVGIRTVIWHSLLCCLFHLFGLGGLISPFCPVNEIVITCAFSDNEFNNSRL